MMLGKSSKKCLSQLVIGFMVIYHGTIRLKKTQIQRWTASETPGLVTVR